MTTAGNQNLFRVAGGVILMAGVSTTGDMVWFGLPLPHRMIYGLLHGTLLCLIIGLYLGALARRPLAGALGGSLVGLFSAGGYYVLAPLTGPAVMFGLWVGLWLLFAGLHERLAHGAVRWRTAGGRAAVAAAMSGAAFYAVSGIWFGNGASTRNYTWHFVAWSLVFLPAFLALLWRPSRQA